VGGGDKGLLFVCDAVGGLRGKKTTHHLRVQKASKKKSTKAGRKATKKGDTQP